MSYKLPEQIEGFIPFHINRMQHMLDRQQEQMDIDSALLEAIPPSRKDRTEGIYHFGKIGVVHRHELWSEQYEHVFRFAQRNEDGSYTYLRQITASTLEGAMITAALLHGANADEREVESHVQFVLKGAGLHAGRNPVKE